MQKKNASQMSILYAIVNIQMNIPCTVICHCNELVLRKVVLKLTFMYF